MKALKRSMVFCLALILSVAFTMTVAAAPQAATGFDLKIDGEAVAFDGQTVVFADGRVLLPLRFLFDSLGGDTIEWIAEERVVVLMNNETETRLTIDTDVALVAGEEVQLDSAAILFNDRTFVPASFLNALMDVTAHVDADSQAVLVADNARLDHIIELMAAAESVDHPPMSADMITYAQMTMVADGITEEVAMRMTGTMKLDPANRFQHMSMITEIMGMEMASEMYDDGEFLYILMEGMVLRMPSMLDLAEGFAAQHSPIAGFDIARQYYAGLRLTETADTFTISGNMIIPEYLFTDFFDSLGGLGDMIPDLDDLDMDMEIRFNAPINFTMTIDRATGFLTYMSMDFDMEMDITVDGDSAFMHMVFTTNMPRITYGVEFDTVVPADIVAAAISLDF